MAPRTRRALFSASLFLATCAILVLLSTKRLLHSPPAMSPTLRDSLHSFTNVYSLVEQNYAEPMNTDKADKAIYDGAIPGMLHVLDPTPNFYDPKAYAQMREDQHGKYYGVGMTIQPQPTANGKTKIVVLYPFEGTPSYKAGIRPGDEILTVDGKSHRRYGQRWRRHPPQRSAWHPCLRYHQPGKAPPAQSSSISSAMRFPRPSVDLAFLIRPGVGYIHVSSFIETTSREVGDALDNFGEIHGLILDLRGNPGGLLNEAVATSDKFLQKGQIVVSHAVVPSQTRSTAPPAVKKVRSFPLLSSSTETPPQLLRSSPAPADHDRALIVGETTFGKGLVQTVFTITENTGLALTTYHYYTPSGRLIQRNYDHVSLYDYYYVRDNDDAKPKDKANLEVKLTDSGRTVYGGGGITPDEKIDNLKSNHFQDTLLTHYAFFNFSKHYLATHTVTKDFDVDDAVMQQFKSFLKDNQIEYTDADVAGVNDWIKESIKSELFTSQFGQLEGLKVRAQWDPQIAKAITFLPEAQDSGRSLQAGPEDDNREPLDSGST